MGKLRHRAVTNVPSPRRWLKSNVDVIWVEEGMESVSVTYLSQQVDPGLQPLTCPTFPHLSVLSAGGTWSHTEACPALNVFFPTKRINKAQACPSKCLPSGWEGPQKQWWGVLYRTPMNKTFCAPVSVCL